MSKKQRKNIDVQKEAIAQVHKILQEAGIMHYMVLGKFPPIEKGQTTTILILHGNSQDIAACMVAGMKRDDFRELMESVVGVLDDPRVKSALANATEEHLSGGEVEETEFEIE